MSQWIRVATTDEIPEGTGKEVVANDQIVAVYRSGDAFYALDGICPHAGGPLGKGQLNGSIVTCPWHGRQFDVTNGQDCLNAKLHQPCFAVKVEGTDIMVELP